MASYAVDVTPPTVYAEAAPGIGSTRTLAVSAWDEATEVDALYLTNDPRFVDNVAVFAPKSRLSWTFDGRGVVWIKAVDSVGNQSAPIGVSMLSSWSLNERICLPQVER
ncbi:MAG: hypothetical protein IPK16_04830 [Anaerolineales bacterium]|nr:hypothetical protein [Anaerolineales bacterium]